jgi:nucleoside-diphosphate-sugar epimerase
VKSVLVTGATGFVGRHLLVRLLASGVQVVAATRSDTSTLPSDVKRTVLDLGHVDSLVPQALDGIDCIFHLAARVHIMNAAADEEAQMHQVNAEATAALARKAASAGVRRFVFLSSIKVNGERTEAKPFVADDEPAPLDGYGRSKWRAEQALLRLAAGTGLEVVIVRPPLVYGPGVGANFRQLMSAAYRAWPLPLAGIENQRSLISIWNLVDVLCRAATESGLTGRAWLVSDGEDVSTPRLLRLLASAMGRPSRLWRIPVPMLRSIASAAGQRERLGKLVDSLQVDIDATRKAMNWRPPVSLEEGIGRTAAWFTEARRESR